MALQYERSLLTFLCALILSVCPLAAAHADTLVFSQPPNPLGGVYKSAWYAPDGLDGDAYTYDSFTLGANAAISAIHWRGGYGYSQQGFPSAPVTAFSVSIYRSIPSGTQPDMGTGGRLVRYNISGNAGQTAAGTSGGVAVYDYAYTLPAPFQAVAGTTYWVQIEASQGIAPQTNWPPDWGVAAGTGGNNAHFNQITGGPFQAPAGDLSFSLYSSSSSTVTIEASVSPTAAGVILGAGSYPINSTVVLDANANAGWGFVNWTANGSPVSVNSHYTFSATANRTLVANFVAAYTVTTSAYPVYGGTVTGAGVYNDGSTATLVATPNHGFVFTGWSDGVASATHASPVSTDLQLTAFFESAPLCATFDFDNAPVHTSLPVSLTVNGLAATFSATNSGFSIQPAGTVGISPPGFSGLEIYPNSVFAADLVVDFSETLVDFSILYSPQELGCDDSATMRATAYMNGAFVATNTYSLPNHGTWPSGTLTIAAPAGFNRVVVHYDARPPTCQNWGPIFLADNVTVTRACVASTLAIQPTTLSVCQSGPAGFSVTASGAGPFTYQWRSGGTPLDASANPSAATATLSLPGVTSADAGLYDCVVGNPCGSATSSAAQLFVDPADLGAQGGVPGSDGLHDNNDFVVFIDLFFTSDPRADVGAQGGILGSDGLFDNNDFVAFIDQFFAPC